jgi:hypothetical protein
MNKAKEKCKQWSRNIWKALVEDIVDGEAPRNLQHTVPIAPEMKVSKLKKIISWKMLISSETNYNETERVKTN